MLRVDLDAREIVASVRELAEWSPGPPRPAGWWGEARAQLGIDVHRRYQGARQQEDPTYGIEVALAATHVVEGFTVRLQGRLDGLAREDGTLVVEEVKSTSEAHSAHFRQLRFYVLLVARTHPQARVGGRLVLISALDGTQRILDVDCDVQRTEQELDARLRLLIAEARREAERARVRAAAADRLSFPYPTMRPGQEELSAAIEQGLETGRPVLATAPTGSGKTVTALLPALRFALRGNYRLYFVTAKTTQQALVARTFCELAVEPLRAVTLGPKARMCPPRTPRVCHPDHCSYLAASLAGGTIEKVVADLRRRDAHVGPDVIWSAGRKAGVCPYALALALCAQADLVICDYNYVYGPSAALEEPDRGAVVVVDEAHNLFDRAREYDSPFLPRPTPTDFHPLPAPEVEDFLHRLGTFVDGAIQRSEAAHPSARDGCRPLVVDVEGFGELARDALRMAMLSEQVLGPTGRNEPLFEVLHLVTRVASLLRTPEPELVPYAAAEGVGVLCVDPSRRLYERHRAMRGTVAMSATLAPLPHWTEALGLARLDPVTYRLPAEVQTNRRVVVVPTVSTRWRDRHRHYGAIARTIAEVTAVRPGHYVAYFPSFAFLEEVRLHLPCASMKMLAQRRGMSVAEGRSLLDELRDDPKPVLLLAVMSGIFAEGIDLPGDALIGAIVVGPGLPQVGFERSCMRTHYETRTGEGFARAMLYPGMQRVIQAAGRVHRGPEDSGIIVLLGQRFAEPGYLRCLPADWYVHEPAELVARDPVPVLRAFWQSCECDGRRLGCFVIEE